MNTQTQLLGTISFDLYEQEVIKYLKDTDNRKKIKMMIESELEQVIENYVGGDLYCAGRFTEVFTDSIDVEFFRNQIGVNVEFNCVQRIHVSNQDWGLEIEDKKNEIEVTGITVYFDGTEENCPIAKKQISEIVYEAAAAIR